MFSCQFCEISRNTFSIEHLRTTASDICIASRNMFKTTIKSLKKSSDLYKVFKHCTNFDVSLLKFVVILQHVLDDWTEKLWLLALFAVIGTKIRTRSYPFSQKCLVLTTKTLVRRISKLKIEGTRRRDWRCPGSLTRSTLARFPISLGCTLYSVCTWV